MGFHTHKEGKLFGFHFDSRGKANLTLPAGGGLICIEREKKEREGEMCW